MGTTLISEVANMVSYWNEGEDIIRFLSNCGLDTTLLERFNMEISYIFLLLLFVLELMVQWKGSRELAGRTVIFVFVFKFNQFGFLIQSQSTHNRLWPEKVSCEYWCATEHIVFSLPLWLVQLRCLIQLWFWRVSSKVSGCFVVFDDSCPGDD